MTMAMIMAIVKAIKVGMDFNTVLDIVKSYTDDFVTTLPDDDNYGYIDIGDTYGNCAVLEFDDNNVLENIDVYSIDDFE